MSSKLISRLGEAALRVLAGMRGFLRANWIVGLGVLIALLAHYCVLDRTGP